MPALAQTRSRGNDYSSSQPGPRFQAAPDNGESHGEEEGILALLQTRHNGNV